MYFKSSSFRFVLFMHTVHFSRLQSDNSDSRCYFFNFVDLFCLCLCPQPGVSGAQGCNIGQPQGPNKVVAWTGVLEWQEVHLSLFNGLVSYILLKVNTNV